MLELLRLLGAVGLRGSSSFAVTPRSHLAHSDVRAVAAGRRLWEHPAALATGGLWCGVELRGPDDTEQFVAPLCYSDLRRLSFPEEASHCSYADSASLA